LNELTAVSPIDGRYASRTVALQDIFSEYALIRERTRVEIRWLIALSDHPGIVEMPPIPDSIRDEVLQIAELSVEDAAAVKAIERTTNHDVKAVEYFIKDKLAAFAELQDKSEFVHFACTSEDINNLSYGCMLTRYRQEHLLPECDSIIATLRSLAHEHAAVPLLSRTHGQTASPSTLGKEFANVVARLERQRDTISKVSILGKINGAVGNYNAHLSAYPDVDWPAFAASFVDSLGLEFNPYTTQIEPHDCVAELFDAVSRFNVTLIDLSRDMFDHLSRKLPISRWQRDLTDSTVLRNLGVGAGYTTIALASLQKGLGKLGVNSHALADDLDNAWEVLAEPIQTIMRQHDVPGAYEALKELTRGNAMDKQSIRAFIETLEIPQSDRQRLLELTPATYTGLALNTAPLTRIDLQHSPKTTGHCW